MTFPVFASGNILQASDMNAVGQWVTKTKTSFSAATSIVADNVFSTNYDNYLLVVRYSTSSTTGLAFQLRVGGSSAATNYNRTLMVATTSVSSSQATSATSITGLFNATNGSFASVGFVWINGPFLAAATNGMGLNSQANGAFTSPQLQICQWNHSTATSYDGFELTIGAGNATGDYVLYGLRN